MRAPDVRVFVPLIAAAVVLFVIGVWVVFGIASRGPGGVTTLQTVQEKGVLFLKDQDVFLVAKDDGVLALSGDSQHVGESVIYCPSSQMFESPAHGEKFDKYGHYYGGPASSDMDQVPTRIVNGVVYIYPEQIIETPHRSHHPLQPQGHFCVPV